MKKPKHVPLRRCVVCRTSSPQKELIRLYRDSSGHWQLDETGKAGGRGAWLCKDKPECHKLKKLGRFFRADAVQVAQQLNDQQLNDQQLNTLEPKNSPPTSPTPGGTNVR